MEAPQAGQTVYECLVCESALLLGAARYVCFCSRKHAICTDCGAPLSYAQASALFGPHHAVRDLETGMAGWGSFSPRCTPKRTTLSRGW